MLKVVQTGSAFRANIKAYVSFKTGATHNSLKAVNIIMKIYGVPFMGFAPTEQPKLVKVITIDYPRV